MSWRDESSVLDEGNTGLLRDTFENPFRDMFLNVTHINILHAYAQFWGSFNRLFGNFMS